ncbi:MAG: F0F1 ATP synthase subunit delta [Neisseria sp.]|nr:F0F1 ATP synthase subunit delta [Neisseria sp.]
MAEFATIARPYAKALYGLAQKHNKLKPWLDELALMAKVAAEPKVAAALAAPELGAGERGEILLNIVASQKPDVLLQNFITVLSENGRLAALPEVFEQYRELALSEEQTQQAVIYSAYPLAGKELDELVAELEKRLHTKLQVRVEVQPDLIGGVKVEFGDQVLDMSVQSKLNALYAAMIN